jgi:hypothetical protein
LQDPKQDRRAHVRSGGNGAAENKHFFLSVFLSHTLIFLSSLCDNDQNWFLLDLYRQNAVSTDP